MGHLGIRGFRGTPVLLAQVATQGSAVSQVFQVSRTRERAGFLGSAESQATVVLLAYLVSLGHLVTVGSVGQVATQAFQVLVATVASLVSQDIRDSAG